MKAKVIIGVVAICWCACAAQQPAAPAPPDKSRQTSQTGASGKSPPKKAADGASKFELNPNEGRAQRSLAMGTLARGGSGTTAVVYAPSLGMTYTVQPVFCWELPRGAQKLTFRLFDAQDDELYETEVTGRDNLAYPLDAPPLKPGAKYYWTIQPRGGQLAESEPVGIIVLSGSDRQQVGQALQIAAGKTKQARLQQARVFVDHGLWYDAVFAYSELIAAYPDQPDLYQDRAEIYDQLPETRSLADQDRAQAQRMHATVKK